MLNVEQMVVVSQFSSYGRGMGGIVRGPQLKILAGMMMLIDVIDRPASLPGIPQIELEPIAMRGAGHAVLRRASSRVHRIGLDEISWTLGSLSENSSFDGLTK